MTSRVHPLAVTTGRVDTSISIANAHDVRPEKENQLQQPQKAELLAVSTTSPRNIAPRTEFHTTTSPSSPLEKPTQSNNRKPESQPESKTTLRNLQRDIQKLREFLHPTKWLPSYLPQLGLSVVHDPIDTNFGLQAVANRLYDAAYLNVICELFAQPAHQLSNNSNNSQMMNGGLDPSACTTNSDGNYCITDHQRDYLRGLFADCKTYSNINTNGADKESPRPATAVLSDLLQVLCSSPFTRLSWLVKDHITKSYPYGYLFFGSNPLTDNGKMFPKSYRFRLPLTIFSGRVTLNLRPFFVFGRHLTIPDIVLIRIPTKSSALVDAITTPFLLAATESRLLAGGDTADKRIDVVYCIAVAPNHTVWVYRAAVSRAYMSKMVYPAVLPPPKVTQPMTERGELKVHRIGPFRYRREPKAAMELVRLLWLLFCDVRTRLGDLEIGFGE